MNTSKPFPIAKQAVWDAYRQVKANRGAAGVDGESIAAFEQHLEGNLYRLWNRMSSGSYFPPPVRKVAIPKAGGRGGVRVLGIPTVTDRIAQTVVQRTLEPLVDPVFHPDSYGYRPGRSALHAVGVCRERCWRQDWVLDLDIAAFFDQMDHALVMKAVRFHTDLRWVHLLIERWLTVPLQEEDGTLVARCQGSPQGSAVSPVLANLYLHYAFDAWMQRTHPHIRFERYCDDIVVHGASRRQIQELLHQIAARLAACGLTVNQEKTRIVYCRDDRRRGSHEHERFDFLGYTFRPRRCQARTGRRFVGFTPAISDAARVRIGQVIRSWRLHLRTGQTLHALATAINRQVRGWITYYGRYYRSWVHPLLRRINGYLMRWARQKYKRLRPSAKRAWRFLAGVATREPDLFAHWRLGLVPRAG